MKFIEVLIVDSFERFGNNIILSRVVFNSVVGFHSVAPPPSLSEGTVTDSTPSMAGRSPASLEEGTISTSASSYHSSTHVMPG